MQVFGTTWCGDCHRARRVLDDLGVPYKWVDVEQDSLGLALLIKVVGKKKVPLVVFPDGSNLVEPSNADLTRKVQAAGLASK